MKQAHTKQVRLTEFMSMGDNQDKICEAILRMLRKAPSWGAEIARRLGVPRYRIYRHLRALKEKGYIEEAGRVGSALLLRAR